MSTPIRPIAERFWEKVERRGSDECWLWRSTRSGNGYGQFWLGRYRPAHQVAWELSHGRPFPEGRQTLHSCDTPLCVNPAHLTPGTQLENAADSVAKRRNWHPIGELHPMARLTAAQIEPMRRMAASGVAQRTVAKRFGVSQATVSRVVLRKGWAA